MPSAAICSMQLFIYEGINWSFRGRGTYGSVRARVWLRRVSRLFQLLGAPILPCVLPSCIPEATCVKGVGGSQVVHERRFAISAWYQ